MTADNLRVQLQQVRQRIRKLLGLYGLSWLVAVLFGGMLLIGTVDWLVHIDDPGIRLLLGLGLLGLLATVLWRLLIAPLRRQLTDVDIALRLENRFPVLQDRFASTIQFLDDNGREYSGSAALQQHVVQETLRMSRELPLEDIVETRPVQRAAWTAVGVCVLTAIVVLLSPLEAMTALQRMITPFADRPWPRTTELVLLDTDFEPLPAPTATGPQQKAQGDTLKLFVENTRGDLPETLAMQYRFGDQPEIITEPARRANLRDAEEQARSVGVVQLQLTKGPLYYRAIGGDDDRMPWRKLDVVPPPIVEQLQVTLTAPSYRGGEETALPAGIGHVEGLLGTQVQVTARLNKPVRSARLRIKDRPPLGMTMTDDGRGVSTTFEINEAGVYSYWFDLQDLSGLENADAPRYEIRGLADAVPEVWIEEPATDRQVTAAAVIPITFGAKDDLGLRRLQLPFQLGESGDAVTAMIGTWDLPERSQQEARQLEWSLLPLNLQPGDRLRFRAEAFDDYDLDGGHIGRSITRTLTIVSAQEKAAELEGRQAGLVDELESLRNRQQQSREHVEQLQIQLERAGGLQPQDVDLLKRVELEQKQITTKLQHPLDGVSARATELLAELANNKLNAPEMQGRLQQIADELRVVQEDHLPQVEHDVISVRKSAEADLAAGANPRDERTRDEQVDSLNHAERHQQAVLDSLDGLLAELSDWRRRRDVTAEVAGLQRDQQELANETAEVGQKTIGRSAAELSPQERADLAKIADRQRKQADRIDQLATELKESSSAGRESNPSAAETMDEAREHLESSAVASRLREAAAQLERNQIGDATGLQEQAATDLEELADIVENRGADDLEELVERMKTAEEQIESLRKRQEELQLKKKAAEQLTDPEQRQSELEKIQKQQAELAREATTLARQLRRLRAGSAGDATRRAAQQMEEAVERLLQEPEAVDELLDEALADLEQAQNDLTEKRLQFEEQLAREMLERISDEIAALVGRQQTVIDETNRLEGERRRRGNLTRGQAKTLRELVVVQRELAAKTGELAELVAAAEVFALALRGAARDMTTAADRLERRLTDTRTVLLVTAARNRCVDLTAALKTSKKKPQNNEDNNPKNGVPETDGIPQLAQLRMLKSLQEDLIRRTQQLDSAQTTNGQLDDDEKAELAQLVEEQSQLADLTRNLTQQFAEAISGDAQNNDDQPGEKQPDAKDTDGKSDPKEKPGKSTDDEIENLLKDFEVGQ